MTNVDRNNIDNLSYLSTVAQHIIIDAQQIESANSIEDIFEQEATYYNDENGTLNQCKPFIIMPNNNHFVFCIAYKKENENGYKVLTFDTLNNQNTNVKANKDTINKLFNNIDSVTNIKVDNRQNGFSCSEVAEAAYDIYTQLTVANDNYSIVLLRDNIKDGLNQFNSNRNNAINRRCGKVVNDSSINPNNNIKYTEVVHKNNNLQGKKENNTYYSKIKPNSNVYNNNQQYHQGTNTNYNYNNPLRSRKNTTRYYPNNTSYNKSKYGDTTYKNEHYNNRLQPNNNKEYPDNESNIRSSDQKTNTGIANQEYINISDATRKNNDTDINLKANNNKSKNTTENNVGEPINKSSKTENKAKPINHQEIIREIKLKVNFSFFRVIWLNIKSFFGDKKSSDLLLIRKSVKSTRLSENIIGIAKKYNLYEEKKEIKEKSTENETKDEKTTTKTHLPQRTQSVNSIKTL